MASKPNLTPEVVRAGVEKNVGEYNARVQALRALHGEGAYNPPVDPNTLATAAAEAGRGAAGLPAMAVYSQDGVIGGDVRSRTPDTEAETQAKARGGKRGGKARGEEAGEGAQGNGGVQAGDFAVLKRGEGQEQGTGDSHSAERGAQGLEVYEAASKEELSEMVPKDAVAVSYRKFWRAYVVVAKR